MTQEGAEVALTNLCDTTRWGDWHSNFRVERRIVGRRKHDSPAADTAHGMPTELDGVTGLIEEITTTWVQFESLVAGRLICR